MNTRIVLFLIVPAATLAVGIALGFTPVGWREGTILAFTAGAAISALAAALNSIKETRRKLRAERKLVTKIAERATTLPPSDSDVVQLKGLIEKILREELTPSEQRETLPGLAQPSPRGQREYILKLLEHARKEQERLLAA
jgi:hypothetical protein